MRRHPDFHELDNVTDDYVAPAAAVSDVLCGQDDRFFLFTPALITTHSEFDRDPVVEFVIRSDLSGATLPFCVDLRKDREFFFSGLGIKSLPGKSKVVDWDKRLYCVDSSVKNLCIDFIAGIVFSNPRSATFGSVFYYDIPVVDPTSAALATINVGVFGVRTNKYISFLAPQLSGVATAVTLPADQLAACPAYITSACALSMQTPDDPLSMREDKNA